MGMYIYAVTAILALVALIWGIYEGRHLDHTTDQAGDIFSDGKPVYNLSGQRVFKGYKEWRWHNAVATFFMFCLVNLCCVNIKQEFGKWFLDVAKYVLTAMLLTSMIEGLSQWWLIATTAAVTVLCLIFGSILMRKGKEEEERKARNRERHRNKNKGGL